MQHTPGHVYGLSYRFSNKKKGGVQPPQIAVTLTAAAWGRLDRALREHPITERVEAAAYLRKEALASWDPQLDLDDAEFFGYGQCGIIERSDSEVRIAFPLLARKTRFITMSLHVLFLAADVFLLSEEEDRASPSSNRQQFFKVQTRCSNESFYAHAAGGYVFPVFRRWLKRKADEQGNLQRAEAAMRDAFYALQEFATKKEERDFKRLMGYDFRAKISPDGRFQLDCPGNACDLAIYPDQIFDENDVDSMCEFSCHNLDSSTQQLTLLSGLAALADIASSEIEQ